MRWIQNFFKSRRARTQWDAGLVWFRLRYAEAERSTRCLYVLSRSQAAGRIALYYQPGEKVSRLYLGVPQTRLRLLKRMATDFELSLKPMLASIDIPNPNPLKAVARLPWHTSFVAQIIDGVASVRLVGGEYLNGKPLPQSVLSNGDSVSSKLWQLPYKPSPGLTIHPNWEDCQLPTHLSSPKPHPEDWLLGRAGSGDILHVPGLVNIYGKSEAVADWLVAQATKMVNMNHANLVIIDGVGNLVPKLKRKAVITQLLGKHLAYVDIDGPSFRNGFNPLAAVPDESNETTVARWQAWFRGMNVHPQGIALLSRAWQERIRDLPALQKWLQKPEREGQVAATSSLRMALNRLMAKRLLREWLEWPANRFAGLPDGALLFACKGDDWARRQLLRSVFLATMPVPNVRIVLHGFPWKMVNAWTVSQRVRSSQRGRSADILSDIQQLVISNGPLLNDSAIVLTESHPQSMATLAERFLGSSERMRENLDLLTRGESIVIKEGNATFTTWQQLGAG